MKKNSVNYCNEKATLIWHYSNGFSKDKGDIRWAITDMYRTVSGEYCLYVSGGPGSYYMAQESISSVWGDGFIYSDGEAIIPMSLEDVIDWGEEYLPDDVLKKVFKDIWQQTKQRNTEIPKILEFSTKSWSRGRRKQKVGLLSLKPTKKLKPNRQGITSSLLNCNCNEKVNACVINLVKRR